MTSVAQHGYPGNSGAETDAQELWVESARFDKRSTDLDLDNALLLMAPEIAEWLDGNTQRLQNALVAHLEHGGRPERALMHLLQDLRGQAGTIGFPLAGRAITALYRLLDSETPAPADVMMAHVDAFKAIVSENARGTDNPLAMALVEALEEFGNLWFSQDSGNHS
jgi:hypothetical protein